MKRLNAFNISLGLTSVYAIISLLTFFTSFGISPFSNLYSWFTFIQSIGMIIYTMLSTDYPEVDLMYVLIVLGLYLLLWLLIYGLLQGILDHKEVKIK